METVSPGGRARSALLALLAGALMPLAYAPFDLYPVCLVSLAVLFALWQQGSRRRAWWTGYLFGVGMFSTGVSWVYISIHQFGHVPLPLSLFLSALFILFLALFPAAAGLAAVTVMDRLALRRRPSLVVLVVPAAWLCGEWLRGWFLTGFPWLLAGYTQLDGPLAGIAPVLGVYGATLFVAISAAVLAVVFAFERGAPAHGGYLLAIVALWGAAALAAPVAWQRPAGPPLQVSLVQGNIPQDIKWLPSMRDPTFALYAGLTRQHWDSDLIIWPETALPSFYHEASAYLEELRDEAQAQSTDLLAGLIYQEPDSSRYYNTMVGLDRAGGRMQLYHKHHLVPFTEYLPMKPVLAGLVGILDVPMSDFSAGSRGQSPLRLAGQRIGMSICYEDAFGEEVIRMLPAATLLVNVSNDAWFGGSVAPFQHLQMARMRALETGRMMLRATNTGLTAVIDSRGRVQALAPQFEEYVLTRQVQPLQGATPYVRFGNAPVLALAAAMVLLALWLSRRRC